MCNIWLLLPLISRKDAKSYYYKLISSLSFQSRANYAQRSLDDTPVNKQKFFSLLSDVWAKLFKSKLWFIDPQPRQQECILECFVETNPARDTPCTLRHHCNNPCKLNFTLQYIHN